MVKKGHNWKSRQVVKTIIDHTSTKEIKLDFKVKGNYDSSNQFALPSKKNKTKKIFDKAKSSKILSKKHRKKLEKIVEKKRKKEERGPLIEALSSFQATPEELKNFTAISTIQSKGLKRYFLEESNLNNKKSKPNEDIAVKEIKLRSTNRLTIKKKDKLNSNDPNIVGFESSDNENNSNDNENVTNTENDNKNIQNLNQLQKIDDNIKLPPEKINKNQEITKNNENENLVEINQDKPPRTPKSNIKAVYVDVNRKESIQKSRMKLPILAEEQHIMETINENDISIIAGETGSGKTTQVPQFLYEAGYALNKQIGVTEPRRVAAISMSRRIAEEMNLSHKQVSYLIRFEGNATDETKIKFMTDGVLLKEIQSDFLLNKYSVIILDEAHERSVYTDILIGLLSRIVPLRRKMRNPLKLIVMSATLKLEDFTDNRRLFKISPPVIKIDTRQFPVSVHFNKRTNDEYCREAFNKVVKIHTKLPAGGILVFLTGQSEVTEMVRKLRKSFPQNQRKSNKKLSKPIIQINLDNYDVPSDNDDCEINSIDSDEDIAPISDQPIWVLPLFSLLPTSEQSEVFRTPPDDCRFCVVSTNVAETSVTIPNIKYVVDCGRSKVKMYDKITGVTNFVVTWISKAAADQRAGRAGRTGPGHTYRLYSSAVYNDVFPKFSQPEIQRKPVDDLYLQMKCMGIDKILNFPFPTAPDLLQLKSAENRLEILDIIKQSQPTPLGKAVTKFPVHPRFGKMLALSHQQNLLPYMVCLVAALSVQQLLLENPINHEDCLKIKETREKWAACRRKWAGSNHSLLLGDAMVLLKAVIAAEVANANNNLENFCLDNGLRLNAVIEIRKLRLQLTNEINSNELMNLDLVVDPKLAPPTDLQVKLLRQILLSGFGDQVAMKVVEEKRAYCTNNLDGLVYLHKSSVLRKIQPQFVVYQEIYESNKIYLRGITAVEAEWLPIYVPFRCNLSEPLKNPEPRFLNGKVYATVNGTFGEKLWPVPNVEIEFKKSLECFKWFAKFLLDGEVFGKLRKFGGALLSRPDIMLKNWANLQKRTEFLLNALISRDVCTKMQLEEVWEKNPKYLLEEYLKWVPESVYSEVMSMWPPLD